MKIIIALLALFGTSQSFAQSNTSDFDGGVVTKYYPQTNSTLFGGTMRVNIRSTESDAPTVVIPFTIATDGSTTASSVGVLLNALSESSDLAVNLGPKLEFARVYNPEYLKELNHTTSLLLNAEIEKKLGKHQGVKLSVFFDLDTLNGTRGADSYPGWSGYYKEQHPDANSSARDNAFNQTVKQFSKTGFGATLRIRIGK